MNSRISLLKMTLDIDRCDLSFEFFLKDSDIPEKLDDFLNIQIQGRMK
jgi:hypothetical protein